jgi:hypothetical protein
MDDLHFLNDNNTLYPLVLVIIILLFYNIVEKETFIQQRNWWIYARTSYQWEVMYNDVYQMTPSIRDTKWDIISLFCCAIYWDHIF